MKIDGHAHACGEYLTKEKILKKLASNQIDQVVLVPGELKSTKTYSLKDFTQKNPQKDVLFTTNVLTKTVIFLTQMTRAIAKGNEHVYQLKTEIPDKIRQFFWITKKQWPHIDQHYNKMQFEGIKLHQCWEGFKITSPWFYEVAEWASQKDLPLFIHMFSHNDVRDLIAFIKEHKKNKIIVAHLFGMELFMEEELKYFDNIFFDLSNTYFVSKERTKLALSHFGPTKLLMGSDTPYGQESLSKSIEMILKLNLPSRDKENILGNNIYHILQKKDG